MPTPPPPTPPRAAAPDLGGQPAAATADQSRILYGLEHGILPSRSAAARARARLAGSGTWIAVAALLLALLAWYVYDDRQARLPDEHALAAAIVRAAPARPPPTVAQPGTDAQPDADAQSDAAAQRSATAAAIVDEAGAMPPPPAAAASAMVASAVTAAPADSPAAAPAAGATTLAPAPRTGAPQRPVKPAHLAQAAKPAGAGSTKRDAMPAPGGDRQARGQHAATAATAARQDGAVAPDSDVALLAAMIGHANSDASLAAPGRPSSGAASRDVVLRSDEQTTAALLQRCRQLGTAERRLCRARICAGPWRRDPACQ